MRNSCHPLLISHCLLLIANCPLPVAYCKLTIGYCKLPIAYCKLPIAHCQLIFLICARMEKPTLPKGTRDFGPAVMAKRQFIFNAIRKPFQKFGFQPLETPAMENLSTLTGKYGEEGDQLLFKILNSGDFLKDVDSQKLTDRNSKSLSWEISEKGLRYD